MKFREKFPHVSGSSLFKIHPEHSVCLSKSTYSLIAIKGDGERNKYANIKDTVQCL